MFSGVYGAVRVAVLLDEVLVPPRALPSAEEALAGKRTVAPTHSWRGSTFGLADCRAANDTPYFAAMPDNVSPERAVTVLGLEVFDAGVPSASMTRR